VAASMKEDRLPAAVLLIVGLHVGAVLGLVALEAVLSSGFSRSPGPVTLVVVLYAGHAWAAATTTGLAVAASSWFDRRLRPWVGFITTIALTLPLLDVGFVLFFLRLVQRVFGISL
jgi:hypothetical protein